MGNFETTIEVNSVPTLQVEFGAQLVWEELTGLRQLDARSDLGAAILD